LQLKVDADIHRGSLERRHQTTVGSRVSARAAVACILHTGVAELYSLWA